MNNRYILANGKEAKSLDLGNPIRDSWDFVEVMKQSEGGDLYAKVAAVFRAMNLTAGAVANIPFVIRKKGSKDEFDTSDQYGNKVEFFPNPRDLIRRWVLSLAFTNTAYGRIAKTNTVKRRVFYVLPNTIDIVKDTVRGEIKGYERKINGVVVDRYAVEDPNLIRIWWLDHTTEILPSQNTEFQAMMNSAGIIHAADWFTQNFFARGGVPPTVLAVKGMVLNDKKEELEKGFTQWLKNVGKYAAKLINAETMDVKRIGDGLGDIKDTPVYRQALENIAMAKGMPLSLLLANSANHATATTEYVAWYRDDVIPRAEWLVEQLNEQLFIPNGYTMELQPEATEPGQAEEVQRAQALNTFVDFLNKCPSAEIAIEAAASYGFELTDGLIAAIQAHFKQAEEKTEPNTETVVEPEEDKDDEGMTAKAWEELDNWRTKAVRYAKRGKPVTFEFKTEHMPTSQVELIVKRLQFAATPDEVKSAFDVTFDDGLTFRLHDDTEIKELVNSINKAVESMSER